MTLTKAPPLTEKALAEKRERNRVAMAAWRAAHPEKARAAWRRYYPKHREAVLARKRALNVTRHGLTVEQYAALLAAQGGRCAVCRRAPARRRLSIDHDHACCPGEHSCGRCIRGLVCGQCNVAIGMMADDPERLVALVEYLRAHA